MLLLAGPAAAKLRPVKSLPGLAVDDRGVPAEGVMLAKGLERLQGSETVRRMEARRRKIPGTMIVSFLAAAVPHTPRPNSICRQPTVPMYGPTTSRSPQTR